MRADGLVSRLRRLGIRIWVEGDRLNYDAPSGVMTAALLEEMRASKQELIRFLREAQGVAMVDEVPPLAPEPRTPGSRLPLSFAQQRLWFLDQLSPGMTGYNSSIALRLRGALELEALRRALDALVERHEALRTAIESEDGIPYQVVSVPQPMTFEIVDLRSVDPGERASAAARYASEELEQPFDLTAGRPIRVRLVRLGEHDQILLLTAHHIVFDGWSMGILYRELEELYTAFARGGTPELAPLEVQYADFAAWQRRWLSGPVWERQASYWRRQLADAPTLEIPTDRPRPAEQTYWAAQHELILSKSLLEAVDRLGRSADATRFMVLLAAFTVLLRRYSGQDDVVLGSPVANRNRLEIEKLIGFFVNSLVLRTDLSGNPSFREVLDRVRRVALEAYQNQDLPFEHLVEELHPVRDRSRNPIFQILFAVHEAGLDTLEFPGIEVSRFERDLATTRLDIEVHAFGSSDGAVVRTLYNRDLFESETIDRMIRHYKRLLGDAVAHPDRPIDELEMQDEAERRRLLVDWNDSFRPYPSDLCIHELFERQVERAPDAVAVVVERGGGSGEIERLTYTELNERANRLADSLRRRGVEPGSLVGLAVTRGPAMPVGMLGILKCGAAYVPLDVTNPRDRLALILEDTSLAALVAETAARDRLPAYAGDVILLDSDAGLSAARGDVNPAPRIGTDGVAYVIYTSGSTGKPKGVEVTHRNVVNFLESMRQEPGFSPRDVMLAVTTLSFDIAVLELLVPLVAGGCVVIAPQDAVSDGTRLRELIDDHEVTVMQGTPATWWLLLHSGWAGKPDLKMLCGGEALPWALAAALLQRGVELWNMYGPTETTVWSSVCRVDSAAGEAEGGVVPIGHPIANTQLYVLDSLGRPVPHGVVGELCIGGAGVTRGYRNRPELTAERFVPDPFGSEAGARIYRTGDLVRYDSRGRLQFLGRSDHQVKVRGFRIELGEIESVLVENPEIAQAAVIVRGEGEGSGLAAFVVPRDGCQPSTPTLRAFLQSRLPDYMIPGVFVPMDALPLSSAGKVDRRQLASIAPELREAARAYTAPRGPEEEVVAAAFAEFLKRESIGAHDNFFELGGHSLLATQLISRLRSTLRTDLPLREVFEHPTVAGLAARVRIAREDDAARERAAPIQAVTRQADLEMSFAQRRLWVLDQMGAGAAYNMTRVYRLRGELDRAALAGSLQDLIRRHEVLRTRFAMRGGKALQVVDEHVDVPLEVTDLSRATGADRDREIQACIEREESGTFDLSRGPVLRTRLIELGQDECLLLLTIHHIACDAWSVGLLARDIAALYESRLGGDPADLPGLPVQYADFAAWQNQRLQGETLRRQLGYWKEQLGGDLPVLNLPTDHPRPPVQTFHGSSHRIALSPELSAAVGRVARAEGVTVAMVLLAAYQALLSRYSGQEDVIVGSPIANRTRSEIEDLVGFFVNSLVLRADLSGNPTFSELLRRVQRSSLNAYDHQDLPFERLVYEIDPERDLSQTPLFQAVFAMQNVPRTELRLPGLVIEDYPIETHRTRFDLELYLSERTDGIGGLLVYNRDLFDGSTVRRMARHFQTLLEGAMANPGRRLSELPLLDADERQQVVVEWNDTAAAYRDDASIHELFESWARRTPESAAVMHRGRTWSYAELNARANQLAAALRDRGVGRDTLVGLSFDRSVEMIVGMLGILKAGGAYVPIDPAYPRERVQFMLEDSGIPILLTQAHLAEALPPHGAQVLRLDADWPTIAGYPVDATLPDVSPEDLAYAIYTSGSTGRPKCALLRHRGLCNVGAEQARSFGVGPGSRVLQFSSLSFDASTFEIAMALLNGAALVLGDPEELLPGPDLLAFLKRNEIGIVTLPPTALAAVPVEELPALETITVAGEACSGELVARWAPGRRFFNLYGPTETTIWATMTRLQPGEPVHIGRPIANTQVYVVDRNLEPVPPGVPGELCIGGVGVARGYHNREALTAERFVPDPFSSDPDARLYRTGDLARFRADGNIEFLGRIDHQVKVRGYRIELGEIEAALDRHPAVGECVVLTREDAPGDRRLVAYVVEKPAGEQESSGEGAAEWRDEHVSHWETLYEQSYRETWTLDAGAFNISGWNSSYTGGPIPADEMRRWVDGTVAAVLAHRPRRVLELGCGNGLLLFGITPHCDQYVGCDFSAAALDYIERNLGELGDAADRVVLRRQRADDSTGIEKGTFDTVILNSVVQYFPDADYLLRVLDAAISSVAPGGRIFVGDVRSLPLFRAFHTSVQAFQAEPDLPAAQLRQRVEHHLNQDQELVVDPGLFVALRKLFPRIAEVSVRPKAGGYDNELSRFRYDVTLYLDEPGEPIATVRWLDWRPGESSLDEVERELRNARPEALGLRGVPNARVLSDALAGERLLGDDAPSTAGALIAAARLAAEGRGVDPDRFLEISDRLPYRVELDWSSASGQGDYDVLLVRRETPSLRPLSFPRVATRARSWSSYTNDPLRGRRVRHLVPELRRHLQSSLPEYMVPAAFVVLDGFPTTPSGKIDRKALPAPDAVRPESAGAYALPRNEAEEVLVGIWARVLGIERVGIHDNFFELGGDSILSIQIVAAAREAGLRLTARDLFQRQTVAELAAAHTSVVDEADQGTITGPVPLTPIEHWFLSGNPEDAHHFNQALFLESSDPLEADIVREAVRQLMIHHDALRTRLQPARNGWAKEIAEPDEQTPFETVDVPALDAAARRTFVEGEAARIQASLDLRQGPLIRVALFRTSGEPDRLLIAIHHLAVDAVSWSILLQDLQRLVVALREGVSAALPPKSTSVRRWAEALVEHARKPELAGEAAYWAELPLQGVGAIPTELHDGPNTVGSIGLASGALSEAGTQALLQEVPTAYGTRIDEVLLTALARALGAWTGARAHLVDVEGHGREPFEDGLDPSRTVGWFTSIYPVLLEPSVDRPSGETLKVTRRTVRAIPGGGLPHGLARWLSPEAELSRRVAGIPGSPVAFNYLGRFDGAGGHDGFLHASDWPVGPARSPRMQRAHMLEINALIRSGRFSTTWAFSRNLHRRETIQRVVDRFLEELDRIIEHRGAPNEIGYSALDFEGFGWDQDDLDDILADAEGGR